jgi:hypothetical protein
MSGHPADLDADVVENGEVEVEVSVGRLSKVQMQGAGEHKDSL